MRILNNGVPKNFKESQLLLLESNNEDLYSVKKVKAFGGIPGIPRGFLGVLGIPGEVRDLTTDARSSLAPRPTCPTIFTFLNCLFSNL